MTRKLVIHGVLALALLMAIPGPAVADHNPNGKRLRFEDCPPEEGSMMMSGFDCSYDEDGHIISQGSDSSGSGALGGLIFLGLLWALVPAFISSSIASGRNQSAGMAFLLGLVLGWIGLALVYFLMKEEGATVTVSTSSEPSTARTSVARMRELQTLKDQGLISDEDYESRKRAILTEV